MSRRFYGPVYFWTHSKTILFIYLFTYLFIYLFIYLFFPRKWNLRNVYERFRSIRCQKGKRSVIKRQKLSFLRAVAFADWFVGLKRYSKFAQNRSKNNLVHENDVTRVHGRTSLQVMGS